MNCTPAYLRGKTKALRGDPRVTGNLADIGDRFFLARASRIVRILEENGVSSRSVRETPKTIPTFSGFTVGSFGEALRTLVADILSDREKQACAERIASALLQEAREKSRGGVLKNPLDISSIRRFLKNHIEQDADLHSRVMCLIKAGMNPSLS